MSVPSLSFLGFGLAVALIMALMPLRGRIHVLLAANLAFLTMFRLTLVQFLPLAGFVLAGYLFVLGVALRKGSHKLIISVILVVAIFVWLKKYDFVPKEILLSGPYLTLGMSYIFFRILHLITDTAQGTLGRKLGLIEYLAYVTDFTCLVAGPIQRIQDFRSSYAPMTVVLSGRAIERVAVGFFKVEIVSAALSALHSQALARLAASSDMFDLLIGMGTYPFYLYANFSGYVDVVLGVALLCQRALPENFDRPFAARNFIEFWSRWHITLSAFLKTYVYNPIMLFAMRQDQSTSFANKVSILAFFTTFFLVGVWHGQTTEFLFFGGLQGGGVALNKMYQLVLTHRLGRRGYRDLSKNWFYSEICRAITLTWFGFTLLWFWTDWKQISQLWWAASPLGFIGAWTMFFFLVLLAMPALDAACNYAAKFSVAGEPATASRYMRTVLVTALVMTNIIVAFLLNAPAPDIIYKAF